MNAMDMGKDVEETPGVSAGLMDSEHRLENYPPHEIVFVLNTLIDLSRLKTEKGVEHRFNEESGELTKQNGK